MEGYKINKGSSELSVSIKFNIKRLKTDFPSSPECMYAQCLIDLLLYHYPNASYKGIKQVKEDKLIVFSL